MLSLSWGIIRLGRLTTFSYSDQIRCINEAAAVSGCSSVDYKCTCPSTAFKDTLGACLDACGSPEDFEGIFSSPIPPLLLFTFQFISRRIGIVWRLGLIGFRLVAGELHKERCGDSPPL